MDPDELHYVRVEFKVMFWQQSLEKIVKTNGKVPFQLD